MGELSRGLGRNPNRRASSLHGKGPGQLEQDPSCPRQLGGGGEGGAVRHGAGSGN